MKFIDLLKQNLREKKSHVCVGLDSQYAKLPAFIKKGRTIAEAIYDFNKNVINCTSDIAVAYKMNIAFYAGYGADGLQGLQMTNEYLETHYPDKQIIADCKRSEMGTSVTMVANEIFQWLRFSCIMVTPWFGLDSIRDYLDDETKGVAVYVHDSNPSAVEIQDLLLADGRRVYEEVAKKVASSDWNLNGNVIAEAAATYPDQLRRIREIVGDESPILVAGVGAQGGTAESLAGLFGKDGQRLIVNSSRGIIFPDAADDQTSYFRAVRQNALLLRNQLREAAQI